MGKKSNKKNKPSKAEKRRRRENEYNLSFSKEHIDEMQKHFISVVSEEWDYLCNMMAENNPDNELLKDEGEKFAYFNQIVSLAQEAWNIAVVCKSSDDAYDLVIANHNNTEGLIIADMLEDKFDRFSQDKLMIKNAKGVRAQDGKYQVSFFSDYTVMDDELDELEEMDERNRFDPSRMLNQEEIDKALDGIPPEFQQAAYEHEVKRQARIIASLYADAIYREANQTSNQLADELSDDSKQKNSPVEQAIYYHILMKAGLDSDGFRSEISQYSETLAENLKKAKQLEDNPSEDQPPEETPSKP